MDKESYLLLFDELFELNPGTIKGTESLNNDDLVDSLAMLGLISLLDEKFNMEMQPSDIQKVGTIDDLYEEISSNTG